MPIVPADRINPLIASFIQTDIQFTDIAEQHGIPLRELLEWLRSPEIAEILDLLDALALRRARAVAAEARITALRRLDYLAASSDDPESARHAAAAILRAAGPLHDTPARAPSATQPHRASDEPRHDLPAPPAPPSTQVPPDLCPANPAPAGPSQPAPTPAQRQPPSAAAPPVPAIIDSRARATDAAPTLNRTASVSERANTPRDHPRPSGSGPAP